MAPRPRCLPRLLLAALGGALAGPVGQAAGGAAEGKKPHVALLVLDDIGWADVGYHGGNLPTPNIDALAGSGAKLERMYVMPQCSPTRAAIMTGRYSFRTGLQHFQTIQPGATPGIPAGVPTLAETFRSGGYATHMVGKWHIGYSSWEQTPLGKGFESFYGYLQGQTDYYNRTLPACADLACVYKVNRGADSPMGPDAAAYDFWDNEKPLTDDFGEYTVDFYEEKLDQILKPYGEKVPPAKPLFLYFAEQQLHVPLQAPPEARHLEGCAGVSGGGGLVNRTILCSMMSRLDESVGKFVGMLKKYNMWNDTLILALSDNGGMTQWGHLWPASASSNHPLRGGKTTLFEGGVRSVAFAAGGALPEAARGTERTALLHAVDILPTLAGFAGVPLLQPGDGLNVWPAIAEAAPVPRKELPINIGVNPLGGVPAWATGFPDDGATNYSALISWPYKLMVGDTYVTVATRDEHRRDGYWSVEGYEFAEPPEDRQLPVRLYDLEKDEREMHNLAALPENADLVKALTERIEFYRQPANGYVKPQRNVPTPLGNPRFHDWVWAPWKRATGDQAEAVVERSSAEKLELVV